MVLVDSSVWINHFRRKDSPLVPLLEEGEVLIHPFVWGELACGNFKSRGLILQYFSSMPKAIPASNEEVLGLIETGNLHGRGIGWVDAHLMASALLTQCAFWTLDTRLRNLARDAGVKVR